MRFRCFGHYLCCIYASLIIFKLINQYLLVNLRGTTQYTDKISPEFPTILSLSGLGFDLLQQLCVLVLHLLKIIHDAIHVV
jgi:hypothetical protein